jgi:hypothetical protein
MGEVTRIRAGLAAGRDFRRKIGIGVVRFRKKGA